MIEHTLLAAQTGAGTSLDIQCTASRPHIHFLCPGMQNGDGDAVIQYKANGNWYDYYLDGEKQVIKATTGSEHSGRVVTAFGTYRVTKPVTTASVPVIAQAGR